MRKTGRGVFVFAGFEAADAKHRRQFLVLLDRLAPDVRGELNVLVGPSFKHAASRASAANLCDSSFVAAAARRDPALARLNDSLSAWAMKFDLDFEWIRGVALRTLAKSDSTDGWAEPLAVKRSPFSDRELQFQFLNEGWNPVETSEWSARSRIRSEFEKALHAYLDGLHRRCLEAGGKEVSETRALRFNHGRPVPAMHVYLRWLVEYQCLHYPKQTIAQTYKRPFATVDRGLESAANAIGIALLPAKAGRPETPDASLKRPRRRSR